MRLGGKSDALAHDANSIDGVDDDIRGVVNDVSALRPESLIDLNPLGMRTGKTRRASVGSLLVSIPEPS